MKSLYSLHNARRGMLATHILKHTFQHTWLVKIHMGPTKFTWDPHNLVEPVWILTNQRECVEKCVLEGVLLTFLNLKMVSVKYTPKKDPFLWKQLDLLMVYVSCTPKPFLDLCKVHKKKFIKISLCIITVASRDIYFWWGPQMNVRSICISFWWVYALPSDWRRKKTF